MGADGSRGVTDVDTANPAVGPDGTPAGPDGTAATRETSAEKSARRKRATIEWIVLIGAALIIALVIKTFLFQAFYIPSESMVPTLKVGDRVLVNKLSYRLHDPRRGDVVVLQTIEGAGERDLIKRVIALPGETVEYRSCVLYVDGRELVEPYLDPAVVTPTSCGEDQAALEVPADHVFVMGDNRPGSKDSRALGPIAYDDLIGRAFVVIWPAGDWRWL